MSVRQLCNVIYAMHTEKLDEEAKAEFDLNLNDSPDGRNRRAARHRRLSMAGEAIHIAG